MSERKYSRRATLRLGALTGAGAILAACQPKVVRETVVVKETVVVEKEVEKSGQGGRRGRERSHARRGKGGQAGGRAQGQGRVALLASPDHRAGLSRKADQRVHGPEPGHRDQDGRRRPGQLQRGDAAPLQGWHAPGHLLEVQSEHARDARSGYDPAIPRGCSELFAGRLPQVDVPGGHQ